MLFRSRKQGRCTQRCRVKPTSSRRGLVGRGGQRGLQRKVASSASTQPPPLSHRKQAPALLSGNSSLASSGSKCLRERTRAGRGAHREERRAEMHRKGAARRHAVGSGRHLEEMPGKAQKQGSWQHWFFLQEEGELLHPQAVATSLESTRGGRKGSLSHHAPGPRPTILGVRRALVRGHIFRQLQGHPAPVKELPQGRRT